MKKLFMASVLSCLSVTVMADIVDFQSLPGFFRLQNQLETLNHCIGRYIDSEKIRAATVGGNLSSAVNFEIDSGGACRLVVADSSYVTADGVTNIDTPFDSSAGLSPALQGQHFSFTPLLEGGQAYSSSSGPTTIKTWSGAYSYESGNADLKHFGVLNTNVNFFAQYSFPLSIVAG